MIMEQALHEFRDKLLADLEERPPLQDPPRGLRFLMESLWALRYEIETKNQILIDRAEMTDKAIQLGASVLRFLIDLC